MIETPYLLFLGDAADPLAAKVARGIRDWRPEHVVGQYRMEGCNADMGVPDLDLAAGRAAGAKTLVVGVANRGGTIAEAWRAILMDALEEGYDIASGLHHRLTDVPGLAEKASELGRRLIDVRVPQTTYPVAEGKRRSGRRVLMVGTDCSVGKMYTGLAMERAASERGVKATFRATGQTGILITGEGVPLDAVVADFMAGSIEWLTPDNDPDHWDIIEGQGSLFHVSFSGVTLALMHGGAPDALVLCHEPTRTHMRGLPDHHLPSLDQLRGLSLPLARIANPDCNVIGVAVNTAAMSEADAMTYLSELEAQMELPVVDPYRQGAGRLVAALPA